MTSFDRWIDRSSNIWWHSGRAVVARGICFRAQNALRRTMLGFYAATMLLAQPGNQPPIFNPPKSYYLALGDFITFGYQRSKAQMNLPPSAYNTGYVDVFAEQLRRINAGITIVNYGCPGESTESFVSGPCPWTQSGLPLHAPYSNTQLQAALAFLNAHRGEVSPVTFTLWGNDFPNLLGLCTMSGQIDTTCVQTHAPSFIGELAGRISAILQKLRAAAPEAEIIVLGAYDPYINALGFADPLFGELNAAIAQSAAANRARFADPFRVFNPQGDLGAEAGTLCTYTLLCVNADSHPSDAGYRALADLVFEASGYSRLMQ